MVNTAARNNLAVKKYGQTLDSSLEELGSRLVALWSSSPSRLPSQGPLGSGHGDFHHPALPS